MSGASTLSKKDLFRLHLREVEYDFNNLADILDSVLEGREEFLAQMSEENAKLRELADAVKEFVEDTHCEDCLCRRDCDDNNRIFCANDFSYHAFAAMRELGIEAEG